MQDASAVSRLAPKDTRVVAWEIAARLVLVLIFVAKLDLVHHRLCVVQLVVVDFARFVSMSADVEGLALPRGSFNVKPDLSAVQEVLVSREN